MACNILLKKKLFKKIVYFICSFNHVLNTYYCITQINKSSVQRFGGQYDFILVKNKNYIFIE